MRKILLAGAASAVVALDFGLVVTAAEAQPVANLPLTCSSASAIGQPQNNCNGDWAYQTPNEQLVVLRGPSSAPTWALAANLAGTDPVAVCSLPVEPGTYSSCKDPSGVRRIGYMAKSQVFGSSIPPPPTSGGAGARVLDLSAPVSITEPGRYVLDRDWDASGLGLAPSQSLLGISADNVTVDMQGFGVSGALLLVAITGNSATVENGRLSTAGRAIIGGGSRSLIDAMRITGTLDLFGGGVVLANSNISGSMMIERGVIVRNNLITSGSGTPWAVRVSEGAFVVDNQLRCGGTTCVTIDRSNNVVSGNVISSRGTAIKVEGGGNQVFDNNVLVNTIGWVADIHLEPVYVYLSGDVAIDVAGGGNTLRGNYVEPFPIGFVPDLITQANPWRVGMRFTAGGNLYGDNVIGAEVPFDLGATVQRDLGGNQPLPVN